MNWEQLTGAVDFVVFEDSLPDGLFQTLAGVADDCASPGCEPELTLPLPTGDRYYLVSGRNDCGTGPKNTPPASFTVIDNASDDLGLTDLQAFFASVDPTPTDYIHVSLDGCTFPKFEWWPAHCRDRSS